MSSIYPNQRCQSQRTDVIIKPAGSQKTPAAFIDVIRKGSGTVVVDGQSYRDECYRQLNDQNFNQKAIDDPTDEINTRECLYLNRLFADDVISKETYNYLLPQNPKLVILTFSLKFTKLETQGSHRISYWASYRKNIRVR